MINGIGTDILDIRRFERLYLNWGNRLLSRLFNKNEIPSYSSKKYLKEKPYTLLKI